MSIIDELFGRSPFGPLVEHTRKVHQCVEMLRPLMVALLNGDREEIHRLQDQVSKREYEADQIKHQIRSHVPRRYFLPVDREDLEAFLRCQDKIADGVEDFAVILLIRKTEIHPQLTHDFLAFVDQIVKIGNMLLSAATELENLVETAFGGAEADTVLRNIAGLGEEEWQADRMQRKLSQKIYALEGKLDPVTVLFYDKLLLALGQIGNDAENTGDLLRTMIIKR